MSNNLINKELALGKELRGYFFENSLDGLRPGAFILWMSLLVHSVPFFGLVSASYAKMLEWSGLGSRETIKRSLEELIDKGYIIRVIKGAGSGRSRVYQLQSLSDRGLSSVSHPASRSHLKVMLEVVDDIMERLSEGREPFGEDEIADEREDADRIVCSTDKNVSITGRG